MLHGIGATLARRLGPGQLRVFPGVSSVALACARLGWPEHETEVVSLVARPPEAALAAMRPGGRVVLLCRDGADPGPGGRAAGGARLGRQRAHRAGAAGRPGRACRRPGAGGRPGQLGPGPGQLGGCLAAGRGFADLCVVGVRPRADDGARAAGRLPGLPDAAFETDGQLTRRELRVLALAALRPGPGELLWDVGAGSGSVGIEWLRAEPLARAVAVEARSDRAERVRRNAAALGVPDLEVVTGPAPAALAGLPPPDAVFVGGGLTADGLLETCWERLRPGGRLVAHAVTVESEAVLHRWQRAEGGQLVRADLSYAGAAGRVHHLAARAAGDPVAGDAAVTVYFVGAGPGAADLLTVRAQRLIAAAPVVLYAGSLVPAEVLEGARPGARLVDTAELNLDAITAELVAAHRAGQDVVRLHSGDPSIFSAVAEQGAAAGRRRACRGRWCPACPRSPRPPRRWARS